MIGNISFSNKLNLSSVKDSIQYKIFKKILSGLLGMLTKESKVLNIAGCIFNKLCEN